MNAGPIRVDLTVFVGRFGSGKTETAINYVLALAQDLIPGTAERQLGSSEASNDVLALAQDLIPHNQSPGLVLNDRERGSDREQSESGEVVLVDLDIVTPYFRTREAAAVMAQRGVRVIAPSVVGQHLDTPAITPQILGAIQQPGHAVVLDVGGDRQGARALGQFSPAICRRGYQLLFVVNPYRPFTGTVQGLAGSIAEIEESARLRVTGLVSNPNLMGATTMPEIVEGHARIERYAEELGLPIAFLCIERRWAGDLAPQLLSQPVLLLDRYFVMSWE